MQAKEPAITTYSPLYNSNKNSTYLHFPRRLLHNTYIFISNNLEKSIFWEITLLIPQNEETNQRKLKDDIYMKKKKLPCMRQKSLAFSTTSVKISGSNGILTHVSKESIEWHGIFGILSKNS